MKYYAGLVIAYLTCDQRCAFSEDYALHIEAYGNNGNHYIYHANTCEWARIATTVQFKFEIVRKKSLLSAAVRYEFAL